VRRVARALAALAIGAVAAFAVLLVLAHRQIRAIDPPLPRVADLRAFAEAGDLPVRVALWNTASQPTPRAQVLDARLDPAPGAPYEMSHPSFVLEWADGRTLLVDLGMDAEQAAEFGRAIRWVGGGDIAPRGSVAERVLPALGAAPLAVAFTHLHTDHVGGVVALCRVRSGAAGVRVLQTPAQAEIVNHTTRPGRALLDAAACVVRERVDEGPAVALPGLPGAFVIHAAGHTPGSQNVGAFVRKPGGVAGYLFAGDAANAIDGVRRDVPKPWAYRTFVVPESDARLAAVRAFLRDAEAAGFTIAIAHDAHHLAATRIPVFDAAQR
jgi:glyoxylase-like metal-dependent hydrolase (beta-lactamase superfamily II)